MQPPKIGDWGVTPDRRTLCVSLDRFQLSGNRGVSQALNHVRDYNVEVTYAVRY
jgi:hypothetical protein